MKRTTCIITQTNRKLEHEALVALLLLPGRHPLRVWGRAIVPRIEPPAVSHSIRASTVSSLHSTRLTHPVWLRRASVLHLPLRLGRPEELACGFPSSLQAALAIKVGACFARWRPYGRLQTLTAACRFRSRVIPPGHCRTVQFIDPLPATDLARGRLIGRKAVVLELPAQLVVSAPGGQHRHIQDHIDIRGARMRRNIGRVGRRHVAWHESAHQAQGTCRHRSASYRPLRDPRPGQRPARTPGSGRAGYLLRWPAPPVGRLIPGARRTYE